jgi:hypothetical protein
MNPDQALFGQRVCVPRESLADKQANCLDGAVLFASLLGGSAVSQLPTGCASWARTAARAAE